MKKEIQDHIILKNKDYSFVKEDGNKSEGLVTDIKFVDGVSEDDFNIQVEFDSTTVETFHSNEVVDIVEMEAGTSV
jgi:hypothetical protein